MGKFSVAIQAGGMSSRMGQEKGLLPIGSVTLVEYIITQVKPLGLEIFLVSNSPDLYEFLGLPVYSDIYQDVGALGGIHTILTYSKTDYVLALACDMPFINLDLIKYMFGLSFDKDIVIPAIGEKEFFEPFRALYSGQCLSEVENAILQGKRRVVSFFDSLEVLKVGRNEIQQFDPEEMTFININTPKDYERVLEKVRL